MTLSFAKRFDLYMQSKEAQKENATRSTAKSVFKDPAGLFGTFKESQISSCLERIVSFILLFIDIQNSGLVFIIGSKINKSQLMSILLNNDTIRLVDLAISDPADKPNSCRDQVPDFLYHFQRRMKDPMTKDCYTLLCGIPVTITAKNFVTHFYR